MILRNVSLENWRALGHFQMTLAPGLNVLQGPNEAGKSTLVEALEWALYTDIVGARLKTEDIRALVPARDPSARPSVCVELVFPDCSAVLTKTLAEDAAKRECHLVIRREGLADEHFDRTDAQKRLRALFSADGLGIERGSVAEGGLLISHQGDGSAFAADGSSVIRSTLGVAGDGTLALTKRLDKVRATVETQRNRELMRDLEFQAIAVARAGTEAARARDELLELRAKKAQLDAVEGEIESLRDEIALLDAQLLEIGPREAEASARVGEMGKRQLEQIEADKAVAQNETRAADAKAAREAAANREGDISHLKLAQSRDEKELARSAAAVKVAQNLLESAHKAHDAAHLLVEGAEHEVEAARGVAEAWRACLAVHDAARAFKREKRDEERLRELGDALLEAQKSLETLPKAPSLAEIRGWRAQWAEIARLENEAARGLQIAVSTPAAQNVVWKSDGGRRETGATLPGEVFKLTATGVLVLEVPGWGEIRVETGARGVNELRGEIAAAREQLKGELRDWKIEISALPGAFEVWEERRLAWDEGESRRRAAADSLRAHEAETGILHEAKNRLREREAELESARAAFGPHDGAVEMRNLTRAEVKERWEAAETVLREATTGANRVKNEAATAIQRLREAETDHAKAAKRPGELAAAIAGRAEQLQRLENDGLDETQRAARLEELARALWSARQELENARARRQELGNGVSAWHIEDARRAAVSLTQERADLEKKLAERRRDLHHFCEQDARAQSEELGAKIEVLEVQNARHEARLRGIALLDAAIKAEGSRLGRALAGPLNEKLSPWLSALRGKETFLEFDDAGNRIEAVLTKELTENGDATISLPFSAQSEGMREQIAFALRLLLASRVAHHLPSKRLPVILDDPFTQTDAARRLGMGTVLRDAAQSLQILFVTCHENHPGGDLDAQWIRIGDWNESEIKTPRKRPEKSGLGSNGLVAETLRLW